MNRWCVVGGLALALMGCSLPPQQPDFSSVDPIERSLALEAAARGNQSVNLRNVIQELESSDPAVRLFAIATLRNLTGQDLGYNPGDAESARTEAINRWWKWLESQPPPPMNPESSPPNT